MESSQPLQNGNEILLTKQIKSKKKKKNSESLQEQQSFIDVVGLINYNLPSQHDVFSYSGSRCFG